jgi:hypothetical protein
LSKSESVPGAETIFMTGEGALSFVDTNVLAYAFDKSSSPKKRVAQRLMNELMDEDRLRVSTQVLQELFVTLTRKVIQRCSSEDALAVLDDLAPAGGRLCGDSSGLGRPSAAFLLGCVGCGCGGADRLDGAVDRGFERWAGDSRRASHQPVRGVIDPCWPSHPAPQAVYGNIVFASNNANLTRTEAGG